MARQWQRSKGTSGQAVMEFALILPVLMLIICGIMDFGLMFSSKVAITNAAREGARYATTHPAWSDWNEIKTRVQNTAKPATVPASNIQIKYLSSDGSDISGCGPYPINTSPSPALSGCLAPGHLIQVNVTHSYQLLTPVLSNWGFPNGVTISSSSTMVEEQ